MSALADARVVPVHTPESAIGTARFWGERLAEGDCQRDRERRLPREEIGTLGAAGLFALTVPREYGGADASVATLTEVVRALSWGDPNAGQVPHSHFVYLNHLRGQRGVAAASIYERVLGGALIANAQTEFGTRHLREYRTTLHPDGPGRWRLTGEKFYCTGSLFADVLAVLAHRDVDGPMAIAWIPAGAEGVEIVDDWDAIGQRTTGSGTVRLHEVPVEDESVTPYPDLGGLATNGAFAQILHAAIDAGIARRAVDEAVHLVGRARPYPDAGVERAAEDPVIVRTFGEIEVAVRGAEALVAAGAAAVDAANAHLTSSSARDASLAVAAARAATSAAAVDAASRLFDAAGARGALAGPNLSRHWRNARTHTLHDPAGWKVQHLGRWVVDRTAPPRHGQI